jgi:DNA polymerase-3 subunit alpha
LVQNQTGYQNLIKLVTAGYLEGFYYRPRIDMELLEKYNEGLICLSGCLKGEIPEKMLTGDYQGAKNADMEPQVFAEANTLGLTTRIVYNCSGGDGTTRYHSI